MFQSVVGLPHQRKRVGDETATLYGQLIKCVSGMKCIKP